MPNDAEVEPDRQLLERILGSPCLPSLPVVALELIGLVQREDVDVQQIAEVIRRDPALAGKLLRTVNSSFYGQPRTISTISQAVVVLGLHAVKTLALGFSLVANLQRQRRVGFDHVAYWKRSLYAAAAARHLARCMGLAQQEEAFLGGLLQDLGAMALSHALGARYGALLAEAAGDHAVLCRLERRAFGFDHAELGGALAASWGLPPLLVGMIRHHEAPAQAQPAALLPLAHAVALGGRVAEVFMSDAPVAARAVLDAALRRNAQLPLFASDELLCAIHRESLQIRALFDLPTGELCPPDEILARANEALVQLSLQSQRRSVQLERQNLRLAAELSIDPLTGVANRRSFDDFVARQFARTSHAREPLSLLFLDTDDFKSVNDLHGHQTGDRVLAALAARLRELVAGAGLVARYGGEEFALVLPRTGAAVAARFAERVRAAVAALALRSEEGDEPLHVTASIGVATHEDGAFARVEELIRAADRAVYAAKIGGRNRVCCASASAMGPSATATAATAAHASAATAEHTRAATAPAVAALEPARP